jgi:protein phosphatase 1G
MGEYLSKPDIKKNSLNGEKAQICFGASSMQGWRLSQNDAYNAILNFDAKTSFFAIYDGHGHEHVEGDVSKYCAKNFPEYLKAHDDYINNEIPDALKKSFLEFDETLIKESCAESDEENIGVDDKKLILNEEGKEIDFFKNGCTALVVLLRDKNLFVANAGQSLCLVCRDGQAIEMSQKHVPSNELERERIEKAGGFVSNDRLNATLNVSRAIGDHLNKSNKDLPFKEQMLTSLPDVKMLDIDYEKDLFMVLVSKSIWNSMNSQGICDFIYEKLKSNHAKLSDICEDVLMHCLVPNLDGESHGLDNMTCILVLFKKEI